MVTFSSASRLVLSDIAAPQPYMEYGIKALECTGLFFQQHYGCASFEKLIHSLPKATTRLLKVPAGSGATVDSDNMCNPLRLSSCPQPSPCRISHFIPTFDAVCFILSFSRRCQGGVQVPFGPSPHAGFSVTSNPEGRHGKRKATSHGARLWVFLDSNPRQGLGETA